MIGFLMLENGAGAPGGPRHVRHPADRRARRVPGRPPRVPGDADLRLQDPRDVREHGRRAAEPAEALTSTVRSSAPARPAAAGRAAGALVGGRRTGAPWPGRAPILSWGRSARALVAGSRGSLADEAVVARLAGHPAGRRPVGPAGGVRGRRSRRWRAWLGPEIGDDEPRRAPSLPDLRQPVLRSRCCCAVTTNNVGH